MMKLDGLNEILMNKNKTKKDFVLNLNLDGATHSVTLMKQRLKGQTNE